MYKQISLECRLTKINKWICEEGIHVNTRMKEWMDRWVEGLIDGWVEGWINKQTQGWMDGLVDE